MGEPIYNKASVYLIMEKYQGVDLDEIKFLAAPVGIPGGGIELKLRKLDKDELSSLNDETGGFETSNIYCLELKDRLVYDEKDFSSFKNKVRELSDALSKYQVKVRDVFSIPKNLASFRLHKDELNQIY